MDVTSILCGIVFMLGVWYAGYALFAGVGRLVEWLEQRRKKRELEQWLGDAWAEFMRETWEKR